MDLVGLQFCVWRLCACVSVCSGVCAHARARHPLVHTICGTNLSSHPSHLILSHLILASRVLARIKTLLLSLSRKSASLLSLTLRENLFSLTELTLSYLRERVRESGRGYSLVRACFFSRSPASRPRESKRERVNGCVRERECVCGRER